MTEKELIKKIKEIDDLQKSLPKVKSGDYLQGFKWSLTSKKRSLNMKLAKLRGNHSVKELQKLLQHSNYCCRLCNSTQISIDHIVPISKGGSNSIKNIQILCISCNSKKGNR